MRCDILRYTHVDIPNLNCLPLKILKMGKTNLVFEVTEAADAKVGLITRPERGGGQPRLVDVRGAVRQAVQAHVAGEVLEHDVKQGLSLPGVTKYLGVLLVAIS